MAKKQAVASQEEGSHHMGAKMAAGAVGVASLAAAAYILFGPNAKQNRKKIRGWAIKMKGEVVEELEKVQHITEPMYQKMVDKMSAKYSKLKNVDPAELEDAIANLRKQWKAMVKEVTPAKKKKA